MKRNPSSDSQNQSDVLVFTEPSVIIGETISAEMPELLKRVPDIVEKVFVCEQKEKHDPSTTVSARVESILAKLVEDGTITVNESRQLQRTTKDWSNQSERARPVGF